MLNRVVCLSLRISEQRENAVRLNEQRASLPIKKRNEQELSDFIKR